MENKQLGKKLLWSGSRELKSFARSYTFGLLLLPLVQHAARDELGDRWLAGTTKWSWGSVLPSFKKRATDRTSLLAGPSWPNSQNSMTSTKRTETPLSLFFVVARPTLNKATVCVVATKDSGATTDGPAQKGRSVLF